MHGPRKVEFIQLSVIEVTVHSVVP